MKRCFMSTVDSRLYELDDKSTALSGTGERILEVGYDDCVTTLHIAALRQCHSNQLRSSRIRKAG